MIVPSRVPGDLDGNADRRATSESTQMESATAPIFSASPQISSATAVTSNATASGNTLISARNISKTYQMGDQTVRALDGVTLDIADGDFVAIMGASGSGKSTMMNLIGALDTPTSGSLTIAGRDIAKMTTDELAALRNQTIGFVFQQFNLLARTSALRQVMLPLLYATPRPDDLEDQARRRLDQVGLGSRLDHHPRQLSGGQQQRVAIARALVNNPKILLADEPTGALDTRTSEDIMRLFTELNSQGITVIIVTHEADIAAYARRRILFRDGKITDDTSADQRAHHLDHEVER